jgi:hypothetical protein
LLQPVFRFDNVYRETERNVTRWQTAYGKALLASGMGFYDENDTSKRNSKVRRQPVG